MNPQKLINYVTLGVLLINILLMYMVVGIFRIEYSAFEDKLADHPDNFNLVFEKLLKFSKESLINFPTIENSFLNGVLEDVHFEKIVKSPESYRAV